MDNFVVKFYTTESGNNPVANFITDVVKKQKTSEAASIKLAIDDLKTYGLKLVKIKPNLIKNIGEDIFKLRPGPNRILFFGYNGKEFILLHGFRKTTQKTPIKEKQIAIDRMKEYKRRNRYE